MKTIEIKANSWYRTRGGEIAYVFGINPYPQGHESIYGSLKDTWLRSWFDGGKYTGDMECIEDLIEHLPDCDSFDWVPKPKILIEAGKKYVLANGDVVGPMELNGSPIGYCWSSRTQPLCAWNNDGLCSFKYKTEYNNIVAEYTEPETTYEPWDFDTMPVIVKVVSKTNSEFKTSYFPHGDCAINAYGTPLSYSELFAKYVQVDGKPCGRVKK